MAKSKKIVLTPEILNKETKQYDKLTKIVFADNRYTEINKKFKPERAEELIQSFSNFIAEYEQHGGKVTTNDFFKYLYLHVVIYFSTIVDKLPESFEEQLSILNQLANNRYIIELQEHFDREEIGMVMAMIIKKLEKYSEMLRNSRDMRNSLLNKIDEMDLDNKEIIKNVLFKQGDGDGE